MIYEALRDGAISPLISQYGYSMLLQCTGPDVINENTGIVTPGALQSWNVIGLEADFELRDIDGTTIKRGDKLLIIANNSILPEPNTEFKVKIGVNTWNILTCKPISPGGVALTYELHIRK